VENTTTVGCNGRKTNKQTNCVVKRVDTQVASSYEDLKLGRSLAFHFVAQQTSSMQDIHLGKLGVGTIVKNLSHFLNS
jgi:hypothetical protein